MKCYCESKGIGRHRRWFVEKTAIYFYQCPNASTSDNHAVSQTAVYSERPELDNRKEP